MLKKLLVEKKVDERKAHARYCVALCRAECRVSHTALSTNTSDARRACI